jgi:hypothetical protein
VERRRPDLFVTLQKRPPGWEGTPGDATPPFPPVAVWRAAGMTARYWARTSVYTTAPPLHSVGTAAHSRRAVPSVRSPATIPTTCRVLASRGTHTHHTFRLSPTTLQSSSASITSRPDRFWSGPGRFYARAGRGGNRGRRRASARFGRVSMRKLRKEQGWRRASSHWRSRGGYYLYCVIDRLFAMIFK